MALWNDRNLPMPPITTFKSHNQNINLKLFAKICAKSIEFFANNEHIRAEYSVLSHMIYRMKQKFRTSKDFKSLEIVCRCLKIYLNTKMGSYFDTLLHLIPDNYDEETYLPSKHVLDYVLIKLQGVSMLLLKLIESCKRSALLLIDRLKIGHFWKIGFIAYAIVSRVYVLCKYSVRELCGFYNKLIPFSFLLKSTNASLFESYEFPTDLKAWLNADWLDYDEDIELVDIYTENPVVALFDLVDSDEDIEFCDEYILVKDDSSRIDDDVGVLRGFGFDDVGEEVDINDSSVMIIDESNNDADINKNKDINDYNDDNDVDKNDFVEFKMKRKRKRRSALSSDSSDGGVELEESVVNVSDDESVVEIDDESPGKTRSGRDFKKKGILGRKRKKKKKRSKKEKLLGKKKSKGKRKLGL